MYMGQSYCFVLRIRSLRYLVVPLFKPINVNKLLIVRTLNCVFGFFNLSIYSPGAGFYDQVRIWRLRTVNWRPLYLAIHFY